jgi:hypothetical protein
MHVDPASMVAAASYTIDLAWRRTETHLQEGARLCRMEAAGLRAVSVLGITSLPTAPV